MWLGVTRIAVVVVVVVVHCCCGCCGGMNRERVLPSDVMRYPDSSSKEMGIFLKKMGVSGSLPV